jgi:hypothetical protein
MQLETGTARLRVAWWTVALALDVSLVIALRVLTNARHEPAEGGRMKLVQRWLLHHGLA